METIDVVAVFLIGFIIGVFFFIVIKAIRDYIYKHNRKRIMREEEERKRLRRKEFHDKAEELRIK